MVVPLLLLAVLSVLGGYVGIPRFLGQFPQFHSQPHHTFAASPLKMVAAVSSP